MLTRFLFLAVLVTVLVVATGAVPVRAGLEHSPQITISPVLQQQSEYDPVLGEMIARVSESEISRTIADLQKYPTRAYPSSGNSEAATYLYNRLAAIPELEVAYQSDTYRNVIATLPGTDSVSDRVVVVGAHYDSHSSDSAIAPGATDNGAGVAIVLELARVMSTHRFDDTIRFAFWNAEESGLAGSTAYVASASGNSVDIPLYLNYDSSSYDPGDQYVLDVMYDGASRPFAEVMTEDNSLYGIGLDLTSNVHTCGSDYVPFRQAGYPAIMTHSRTHAPEAHTQDDTIDLVSLSYARKNAQLGMLLLADTAERSTQNVAPTAVPVPSGSAPAAGATASPVVASPISSPVVVPTVTSAVSPNFTFGTRRYVVGAVPMNPAAGTAGGAPRNAPVSVRSRKIGTGIAAGTTPPAGRFVRWSPLTRWRAGRTT